MLWTLMLLISACRVTIAVSPQQVAKNYTDSLLARVLPDWSKPWSKETREDAPGSCYVLGQGCPSATFVRRETLTKPANETTLELSVTYDAYPQKRFLNLNGRPVRLDAEDATWKINGTDKSWNVGASKDVGGFITVSGGRSQNVHESVMDITSLRMSEECPPYHECRFESWVYYIEYTGQCQRLAALDCRGEIDVCDESTTVVNIILGNRSSQHICTYRWKEWVRQTCKDTSGPQFGTQPVASCSNRIPIMEPLGDRPLSTLVFVKEDHSGKPAPKAISGRENCVFELNTGQWYDSVTGKYWVPENTAAGWFTIPDEPAPEIPDSVRLSDCPASKDKTSGTGTDARAFGTSNGALNAIGRQSPRKRQVQPHNIEVKVLAGFMGSFD